MGKHPARLLANSRKPSTKMFHNKRKARTCRIHEYPGNVRANSKKALKQLNRRVPNGTHGGVRGRPLMGPPTQLKMENKWLVTNHNFEFSCPAWDFDCRVKFIWTQ